jgi:hypothetical protein
VKASDPGKSSPPSAQKALHTIGLLFKEGDVIEIRALNVDQGPNLYERSRYGARIVFVLIVGGVERVQNNDLGGGPGCSSQ